MKSAFNTEEPLVGTSQGTVKSSRRSGYSSTSHREVIGPSLFAAAGPWIPDGWTDRWMAVLAHSQPAAEFSLNSLSITHHLVYTEETTTRTDFSPKLTLINFYFALTDDEE